MRVEYTARVDKGTPITLHELREFVFVNGVDLDDDAEVFVAGGEPVDTLTIRPRAVDERLSNGAERTVFTECAECNKERAATGSTTYRCSDCRAAGFGTERGGWTVHKSIEDALKAHAASWGKVVGAFDPGGNLEPGMAYVKAKGRSVQTLDRAVGVFVDATEGKGRGVTYAEAAAHGNVDEASLRLQADRAFVAGLLVVSNVSNPEGPEVMATINGAALARYDIAKSLDDQPAVQDAARVGTDESINVENDNHLVGIVKAETGTGPGDSWDVDYVRLANLWDRGTTALNKSLDRCLTARRLFSVTRNNVMHFAANPFKGEQ